MALNNKKAWLCSVCGYVYHGSESPDVCPICGAPRESFEVHVTQAKPLEKPDIKSWQCLNCGFVHSGSEPPETCQVCGSPKDCFEAIVEVAEKSDQDGTDTKVVVVGAGIAGLAAVESIRNASPNAEIILISKESNLPYYRINLTRYLAGEITEEELQIKPESWFVENRVQVLSGTEVIKLLLDQKAVELSHGDLLPFDKLILTAGAHPFIPPFQGSYKEGVITLRTLADTNKILQSDLNNKNCVCIGGGLLGLETAGAIARRGANITLLEGHGWLLPRQLNKRAGSIVAKHVNNSGIKLVTKASIQELLGDECVRGVLLEDGSTINADLVIIATGIRSNSYLGRIAGLDVNHGIVVDNFLLTSHPDVFAAGDIAEHRGCVYGTWGPAQYQGSIAGMNAVGAKTEFGGISRSNALKVLDLEMFSIGQIEAEDGSYKTIDSETDDSFFRFVFRDSHLIGSILLGDAKISAQVKKALEGKLDFSDLLDRHPLAEEVIQFIVEHT